MRTEPELLNERLDRLALVLDEIMPNCANLVRDALELLKEKETVKPIIYKKEFTLDGTFGEISLATCSCCGNHLEQPLSDSPGWRFCPHCGRELKWDAGQKDGY